MTRSRISKAGVFLLISVMLLITTPAWADDGGFTETFEDPGLVKWERQGDTIVEEGILKLSPPGMVTRQGTWSGITLTVKLRIDADGLAVIDYMVGESQHYSLTVLPDQIFLEKITNTAPERLWDVADPALVADWNTVKIEYGGTDHTIALNDQVLATVADPDPLAPGGVRLHVPENSVVEFDEVILEAQSGDGIAPDGAVPPPEEQPPPGGEEPTPTPGDTGTVTDPAGQVPAEPGFLAEFFSSQPGSIELQTFAINLLLAAIAAFILSLVYIHWGSSLSNRRVFAANFMLLTMTTTSIILVVRSSVALSLGLVGALSIVRFRAAVKEPEELAYLFLAIGLGIGLGDNQRLVVLLTLVVAVVVMGLMKLFRNTKADANLHLAVASNAPNKVDLDAIVGVLDQHCSKAKLLRYDENAEALETSFVVEFKHSSDIGQTNAALKSLSPSIDITLMDNQGIW